MIVPCVSIVVGVVCGVWCVVCFCEVCVCFLLCGVFL